METSMTDRLPCCVCGSKNVVALVRYTHPMCQKCFKNYEKNRATVRVKWIEESKNNNHLNTNGGA